MKTGLRRWALFGALSWGPALSRSGSWRARSWGSLSFRTLSLAAVSWSTLACTPSASLRGGSVVARGQEPAGVVMARYTARGCVDAAGQSASVQRGDVWIVRGEDGVTRLVETLGGYDSLVVENSFATEAEWVFQLSTNMLPEPLLNGAASPRDDLLFDYRLPREGCGHGRLGLVRAWRETRHEGRIRAHFDAPAVVCRLEREPVGVP